MKKEAVNQEKQFNEKETKELLKELNRKLLDFKIKSQDNLSSLRKVYLKQYYETYNEIIKIEKLLKDKNGNT